MSSYKYDFKQLIVVVFLIVTRYFYNMADYMKTITSTDATQHFADAVKLGLKEPVLITKDGVPQSVLMGWNEYQRLIKLEKDFWGKLGWIAESVGFMDDTEMNQWIEEKALAEFKN